MERAFYGTEGFTPGQIGALIHRMNLGGESGITDEYAQSVWVYACARVRANAVASAPFQLWTSKQDNGRVVESGSLIEALAHPNPWMSGRRLWWLTQLFKDLDGSCLWAFYGTKSGALAPIAPGEIPTEIYPFRGAKVSAEYDAKTLLPIQYRLSGPGVDGVTIPAHSALLMVDPDPADWRRGFAPVDAITRLLNIDFQLDRYDAAMAERGGVPAVAWASDTPLTDTAAKQARERLEDRMLGVTNAGRPLVLGNGIKPIPIGQTATDMGHQNRRVWNRDAIMAAYGVTKPQLSITDDVNRANAREAAAVFWEGTMPAVLRDLEDDFQERFLRTRKGPEKNYAAAFNLDDIEALSDTLDAKIARAEKLVGMGVPFAAATKLANWDVDEDVLAEITDAEEAAAEQAVAAADAALAQAEATPTPVAEDEPRSTAPVRKSAQTERERLIEEAARYEAKIAKKVVASHTSYMLAYRRKLTEWVETNRSAAPAVTRASEADVASLFNAIRPSVEEFAPKLGADVQPLLRALFDASAKSLADSLGVEARSPKLNEAAVLISKRVRLVEGTLTTLSAEVTDALARAITAAEGFSSASLSEAVQGALESMRGEIRHKLDNLPARAGTIARTEAVSVQGTARVNEMRAHGVKRHQWASDVDAATRESHAALDGEVRAIGETFIAGMTLRWPGDPDAPIAQVANCRCAVMPVLEDDET